MAISFLAFVCHAVAGDAWDPIDDTSRSGTWINPVNVELLHGPHALGSDDLGDWFRLNVQEGHTYYIRCRDDMFNNLTARLFRDPDQLDQVWVDNYPSGKSFSADFTGIYYLRIHTQSLGSSGGYTLGCTDITDPDDFYEQNDSLSTAYWFGLENTWLSTTHDYGIQSDDDWYKISVDSEHLLVKIECKFAHADGDINIQLCDESGAVLDQSTSTSDDEYIEHEAPSSGWYYIRTFNGNSGNTYDLRWDDVLPSQASSLTISDSEQAFSSTGGSHSFDINANVSWTVTDNADWVHITSASSGSGNGVVSYDVDPSENTSSRSATVTVSGNGITQAHQITQEAALPTLNIDDTNEVFDYTGDSHSIHVDGNVAWTTEIEGGSSWITITSGASGDGDGTITYRVDPREYTGSRYAYIAVTGGGITRYHDITQTGAPATLTIDDDAESFEYEGGTHSFHISGSVSWTVSDDVSWVNITSASSGLGGGTVSYSVLENTGTLPRYADIEIAGGGITRYHEISQAATPTRVIALQGDLAFGNVLVGSSVTRILTISNTGNSALNVTEISYPDGFGGDWNGGTIQPGASQNVTITFSPTSSASYSGTITVSSDKTDGINTYNCSGTGFTYQPPNTPSNVSPPNGSTDVELTPTLTVSAFSDPDGDQHVASWWQVMDASMASFVINTGEITDQLTSYNVTSGLRYGPWRYQWRVKYKDSRGAWSEWSSFTSFYTPPTPSSGTIQFKSATYSVAENGTTVRLYVSRAGGSYGTARVVIYYSDSSDTATLNTDYTATLSELNWADSDAFDKYIDIGIPNDSTYEGDEFFTVKLIGPSGASLGSPASAVVTITEDDPVPPRGTLQFSSSSYSESESAGSIRLTVSRTDGSYGAAGINYSTANGTASAGSDYTSRSGTLTWTDGDAGDKYIDVALLNDTAYEGTEAFTVNLSGESGASLGSPSSATVSISDDDTPAAGSVQFSSSGYSWTETSSSVQTLYVYVQRSGGSYGVASVHYATANGTATAGTDYEASSGTLTWTDGDTSQKQIAVNILYDSIYEGNEAFTINLSNASGASLGAPNVFSVTIIDDESPPSPGTVQFAVSSAANLENAGSIELWVTREDGSAGAGSVDYATVDGTASAGSDYVAKSGTLTWGDGDSSAKSFVVSFLDDSEYEGDESLSIVLSNPVEVEIGSGSSIPVTIQENDPVPSCGTLQFSSPTYSESEGTESIRLTVNRINGNYGAASVNYATSDTSVKLVQIHSDSMNGVASAGLDYTAQTGTLSWPNGDTSDRYIDVALLDDSIYEGDETFVVTLSGEVGVELGATNVSVVTIIEDDPPQTGTLQFTSASYSTVEDAGNIRISVSREGGVAGEASVICSTADDTATSGEDYVAKTEPLIWADGDSGDKYLDIPILTDSLEEENETFTLSLTNVSGASLGTLASTTVTISNVTAPSCIMTNLTVAQRPGTKLVDVYYDLYSTGTNNPNISLSRSDPSIFFRTTESESFENNQAETSAEGWSVYWSWSWNTCKIVDTPVSDGTKSIKIAGAGGSCTGVYKNNSFGTNWVAISFDVYIPSSNGHNGNPTLFGYGGFTCYFKMNEDSTAFSVNNIGASELVNFAADQWHTFKLHFDYEAGIIRIEHPESGKISDDIGFTVNMNGGWASDFSLYGQHSSGGGGITGQAYYDNIKFGNEHHQQLTLTHVSGDVGLNVLPGSSRHIVWDAGNEWPGNVATGMTFAVTAYDGSMPPKDMVLISTGTNDVTDPDFGAYSLIADAYYAGETETTKAQWDDVYDWASSNGYSFAHAGLAKGTDHPVHTVSWFDCVKWCNAKSEKEGRFPCYTVSGVVYRAGMSFPECDFSVDGYRLPTVEEWEYASRGGSPSNRFPWGDTITHSNANYYSNASYPYDVSSTRGYHPEYSTGDLPYTSPVGSFAPNDYGLYDISGNLWEWCWDFKPDEGEWTRSARGGGWDLEFSPEHARCGHPGATGAQEAWKAVGFRPVCRYFPISTTILLINANIDTRDYVFTVSSEHGTPIPRAGSHSNYCWQSSVTCSVNNAVASGATNWVASGWTALGTSLPNGSTNHAVQIMTNPAASLTWNWNTNYWVEATASGSGSVDFSSGWIPEGTVLQITGTPNQYYRLSHWNGDISWTNNPVEISVDAPKSVMAVFVEVVTETDEVPHQWLSDQGFDLDANDPEFIVNIDHDLDGYTTGQEYVLGTCPTNRASAFCVTGNMPSIESNSGFVIRWNAVSNRHYSVLCSTNLTEGFKMLTPDLEYPQNSYTDAAHETKSKAFYRIEVRLK